MASEPFRFVLGWVEVWSPPHQLTLRAAAGFAALPMETMVAVSFAAERGGTQVTVVHRGLDAVVQCSLAAVFWGDLLLRLTPADPTP